MVSIPSPDQDKLSELARQFHIRRLALFGSGARGALTDESDIDLLIEFDPLHAPSFWKYPELETRFSQLFGGRKVDLVPFSVLRNPYRRRTIEKDMRMLFHAD